MFLSYKVIVSEEIVHDPPKICSVAYAKVTTSNKNYIKMNETIYNIAL
jgi:hypothetical protein